MSGMLAGKIKNKLILFTIAQALFVSGLIGSTNCMAEIYQGEDKNGRIYFGDKLPKVDMKIKKIEQGDRRTTIIKGQSKDASRNIEQAQDWYKERLKQSKIEDKNTEIEKAAKKREHIRKRKKCEKSRKILNDKKADLKARKRAGIRPKKEKRIKIKIEQLKRDVDYFC